VIVRDVFHGDAARFSMAVAAFGIGGLAGAVVLLFVDSSAGRRALTGGFAVTYGAALVAIAHEAWFVPLLVLLVLAGLSMSISNPSANTLVQSIAPDALRGQTVSLYLLSIRGGMSMGALVTGAAVGVFGIRAALLVNGVLAVIVQLLLLWTWRRPPERRAVRAPTAEADAVRRARAHRPAVPCSDDGFGERRPDTSGSRSIGFRRPAGRIALRQGA
jgi:MFS family permease